ncbi:Succinate dehydrogenase/fumarate reductase, flavoprotein subunit [Saccharopolyspora kobensis]|uniref:Succinate dehydrogenase/fumarate reductase, flavoprotein subunit n=1 Tax=Saccharopolyspora kobensis TaxID=146035 RepID=A0A1H5VNB1_9PSEU|nr:3-ketosteroid-delta-1-dehydrogenase [Saccharopolyspora kobensis]SEF88301.1 Succinate dehydrogenase/fumarate reductase, flavoprotein subunit [Saccharopolyspora kobensis]SFC59412.1 Succinate dehydrogenase/fumarate reductase, flavoprotein subunit [Saccharopolyspora kobensis]
MPTSTPPAPTPARDAAVDLVVIGSGTGMAAALAGHEQGLDVLIVEKTDHVGGSTALSGGAFWIPASSLLAEEGAVDSPERAEAYLRSVVRGTSPDERWESFLRHGDETIRMLQRTTSMRFMWSKGYSDYHPELPGGVAAGRSCECKPFDVATLGAERARLRSSALKSPVPMPITGYDYKWMNLMARVPSRGVPRVALRMAQGIGGKLLGREYVAGGQALAAGLYAGVLRAGIPVWTRTALQRLTAEDGRVTGVVLEQGGREVTVRARRGVVLAAGGFDHDIAWRKEFQSEALEPGWSLGNKGNTGDAIRIGQQAGADIDLMDQAWWFPAVAPLPGGAPSVLLAERSLPGSLIVDGRGNRFGNESTDYMSFGQRVLERERSGDAVGPMWMVFDQRYRNSYVYAGGLFPRMALPDRWYEAGIAHRSDDPADLARRAGLPEADFVATLRRFNELAAAGVDDDFHRGASAYDRYYGDPTVTPNPNLRPLNGPLYAVRIILGDLGTCGGLRADGRGRVLRPDGSPIGGLYAIGNTAANAFGATYPGAGATIGQGLVFGNVAAKHAASQG